MKHLKRFNEEVKDINELQSFCDDYLAYLYDTGFNAIVTDSGSVYNMCIHRVSKRRESNPFLVHSSDTFSWDQVKDYLIPFLSVYIDRYKHGKYSINGVGIYTCKEADNANKMSSLDRQMHRYNRWENIYIEGKSIDILLEDNFDYNIIDNIQIIINKY